MEVTLSSIEEAAKRLEGVVENTQLQYSKRLSEKYNAQIYIKREDLQEVRSFKIRGAYNKISSLSKTEQKKGVVCASAGNHAQGFAWSCAKMKIKGTIFMPVISPNQKIDKVRHFGGQYVEVKLIGDTFDDAYVASQIYAKENNAVYVHPFDDPYTISGQGTIGKELYQELGDKLDVFIGSTGGGGLISGVATYLKSKNPKVKIFTSEPAGAAAMYESRKKGSVIKLEKIDTFVDGAALKTVGNLTFKICEKYVDDIFKVPEGKVCSVMVELYQNEGIITEPAGALAIAALDDVAEQIKGKTVVCIISGGNNDILRYPEVLEKSLVYQGRKYYFIIEFAQKPGQLKNFLNNALGPTDDIVLFEYIKKTNKERGPALVGIELQDKKDFQPLQKRMDSIGLNFKVITGDDLLFNYLI